MLYSIHAECELAYEQQKRLDQQTPPQPSINHNHTISGTNHDRSSMQDSPQKQPIVSTTASEDDKTVDALMSPSASSPAQPASAIWLSYLEQLFYIFRNLFLLNDTTLIEYLVADEQMMSTTATLEYDPAYSVNTNTNAEPHDYHYHRSFLSATQFFSFSSLSSADPCIPSKIKQSYHLTYVKDVLLLRHLDDAVLASLSTMLFLNSVNLITKMNEKHEWMKQVMEMMKAVIEPQQRLEQLQHQQQEQHALIDDDEQMNHHTSSSPTSSTASTASPPSSQQPPSSASPSLPSSSPQLLSLSSASHESIRRHLFSFLQELLLLAKNVQVTLRDSFYSALIDHGLIQIIEHTMSQIQHREAQKLKERRRQRRHRRKQHASSSSAPFISSISVQELEADKEREKEEKEDMWLWICCTDMLTNLLMHDPTLIRNYIIATQQQQSSLVSSQRHSQQQPHTPQQQRLSAADSNHHTESNNVDTIHDTHPPTRSLSTSSSVTTTTASTPGAEPPTTQPTTTTAPAEDLLSVLFSTFHSGCLYLGMGHQLSCMLRLLLDPDLLGSPSVDEDASLAFLDFVYYTHMPPLVTALMKPAADSPLAALQSHFHIIELLTFCVLQHSQHFPTFATTTELFPVLYRFLTQLKPSAKE